MKLLVADEEADAGSGSRELNRHARTKHSRAKGNRLAGETRRPKSEDRKKAEGRNPIRPCIMPRAGRFRGLSLAGNGLLDKFIAVPGR
jgi:hypothetical protein